MVLTSMLPEAETYVQGGVADNGPANHYKIFSSYTVSSDSDTVGCSAPAGKTGVALWSLRSRLKKKSLLI